MDTNILPKLHLFFGAVSGGACANDVRYPLWRGSPPGAGRYLLLLPPLQHVLNDAIRSLQSCSLDEKRGAQPSPQGERVAVATTISVMSNSAAFPLTKILGPCGWNGILILLIARKRISRQVGHC